MKRKRFSEEQIAFALRQAESGTTIEEICRKMGVSEPTFYRWKKVCAIRWHGHFPNGGGRCASAGGATGAHREEEGLVMAGRWMAG